jgi:hypothetical protein
MTRRKTTRFVLVGALGDGIVVMAPTNCLGDSTLTRLSFDGSVPVRSLEPVRPPGITYRDKGQVVVTFDGLAWEYDATPDVETVERWMATTPAGSRLGVPDVR